MPEYFETNYDTLNAFWRADRKTWGFWERWYYGMFDGRPLPWELQKQVALIPNDVWEEGPEAVAEEIAKIEARLKLSSRIEDLEQASLVKPKPARSWWQPSSRTD